MSEGGMENSASRLESFGRKLILSLPEVEDESPGRPFLEMLRRKFWESCAGFCARLCQACECDVWPGLVCGRRVDRELYDAFRVSGDIFNITQSVRLTAVKTAGPAELLAIKPLSDFVEDFLSSHIFTESFSNLADGRSCDLLDRSASQLISLYNSALDYLMDKAVDVCLREISWPAQKMLVTEIEKMKLPEFEDCCARSGLLC